MSYKASINDNVELLVDVPSDFDNGIIPKGSRSIVVERYEHPKEGYSIDVVIPDATLIGGLRYENVVLTPDQFNVTAVSPDEDDDEDGIVIA